MSDPLENVLCLCIGGVLLTAGLAKWRLGPTGFSLAIQGYRILPLRSSQLAARGLIVLEIAIGVALLVGVARSAVVVMAAALLTAFAAAMALSLARGLAADCGCSSFVGHQRIAWRLVYRNLALSAALAPVAVTSGSGPLLVGLVGSASLVLGLIHVGSVFVPRYSPRGWGGSSR